MNQNEIINRLKEPFPFNELEWRVLHTTQDKARGLVAAFVDNRAIQRRLDEAAGVFGWRNEYQQWQEKSQVCGIGVYCGEKQEWIFKYDGAENTDYESIKGGLSDSMKRAAVQWGIGRYLYEMPKNLWVDVEPKGKSFSIKQDQYARLETEYNAAIAKLFNTAPPPTQNGAPTKPQTPVQPAQQSQSEPPPNAPSLAPDMYIVHSVKPSGKSSQVLELVDDNGEVTTAYIKSSDTAIKAGICIRNVDIESKPSQYGPYNLINAYELAAA